MLTATVIDFGAYRASRDVRADVPANDDDFSSTPNATQQSLTVPYDLREIQEKQPPNDKLRRSFSAAATLSAILHAGLAAYLMWTPPIAGIGVGGQELETVSVEIVNSSAFESLMANAASNAGGAAALIEAATGSNAAINQAEVAAETKMTSQLPVKEQPEAFLKPDINPEVPSEIPTADVVKPDPKPLEIERVPAGQEATPDSGKDQNNVAAQGAATAGAATTQVASESIDAEGRASASAGQLTKFAMEVRLALGRSRPKHDGARGRVSILFGVTEAGDIRFSEITKSSGSERLDRIALKAIASAKMPKPPSGLTDAQRTYTVPFEFK
ncbi:MAG: TonB family protein [Hyphomicrobiaceae bacterium]|nr:TonB family protein [Hyphomicrobiaceae bacterium]